MVDRSRITPQPRSCLPLGGLIFELIHSPPWIRFYFLANFIFNLPSLIHLLSLSSFFLLTFLCHFLIYNLCAINNYIYACITAELVKYVYKIVHIYIYSYLIVLSFYLYHHYIHIICFLISYLFFHVFIYSLNCPIEVCGNAHIYLKL